MGTLATAANGGVCIHFDERVKRVIGRKDHSALTVEDRDGLVKEVTDRADT